MISHGELQPAFKVEGKCCHGRSSLLLIWIQICFVSVHNNFWKWTILRNTNRSESQSTTTTTFTMGSGFLATSQASSTTAMSMMHPRPNSAPSQTDGHACDETVRSEYNRLFGYRPPAPAQGRMLRGLSRQSPYTNSHSAQGRANSTWTRSFVCLAVAGQQTPPSMAERIDLSLNGLGEKN